MLNKALYGVVAVIFFGLGFITAQLSENEQTHWDAQFDRVAQNPSMQHDSDMTSLLGMTPNQSIQASQQTARQQLNQLHVFIANTSDEKIDAYLSQLFPKADLSQIEDKKRFSQHLLNEFVQSHKDQQEHFVGQVIVSTQEQVPQQINELNTVYKSQQLFAHLDTQNKIQNVQQVFIRWIYRDTGEVLLFLPQNISPDRAQNWVSFTPPQGWKVGHYDVRYYQMNNDLIPIAQTSFKIAAVIE